MVDKISLKKDQSYTVHLTIYLSKASYKPILLGQKGKNIKKIGTEARKDLEKIFKRKYHLFIFLKHLNKNNSVRI